MDFLSVTRAELNKNRFWNYQGEIGESNQLILIRLRVIHADVNQARSMPAHLAAQRRESFHVGGKKRMIFHAQQVDLSLNLLNYCLPLPVPEHRNRAEFFAQIFRAEHVDAGMNLLQGFTMTPESGNGHFAVKDAETP